MEVAGSGHRESRENAEAPTPRTVAAAVHTASSASSEALRGEEPLFLLSAPDLEGGLCNGFSQVQGREIKTDWATEVGNKLIVLLLPLSSLLFQKDNSDQGDC